MNKLIAILAWPFTTAAAYVDTRPTASQVKEHLARHEVTYIRQEHSVVAALRLTGTEVVKTPKEPKMLTSPADLELTGYLTGLQHGFGMAQEATRDLTRSEFKSDTSAIRAAAPVAKEAEPRREETTQIQTEAMLPAGGTA